MAGWNPMKTAIINPISIGVEKTYKKERGLWF